MTRANGWAGGSGRTGFNEQLHHLWRTRPVRLPRRGPIAGVAAGFGQRYGVDPVLVRVAFVVSTIFGGTGIVLYLLAWLLMPAANDDVSAAESLIGRGHSAQSPTRTLVLIVALVIAVSTVGPAGAWLGGVGLISFALMAAGWWLLYLRQPNPPAGSLDPLLPDGGPAPTGYPGVFPGTPSWTGPTYGPFTKLPDHYEPDAPKDAAEQQFSAPDKTTEVITPPPDAAASSNAAVLRSDIPMDAPAGEQDSSEGTATDQESPRAAATEASAAQPKSPPTNPFRTTPNPSDIGPTASGWDPLGVSPLDWDLPDPTPRGPVAPPPPPPPRPRSRLTPIVIGSAVLAAALAGALMAADVHWITPGRIGAVALAVVGLGMLIGAFLRRGYGLMVLAAPLAGFVILASLGGPVKFDRSAVGDHTWAPVTMAELNSDYKTTMGDGTLDLRSLQLSENRAVRVRVRGGDFHALVPASMRLDARCSAKLGDVNCPHGIVGPATGPLLTLDIDVKAGDAEVTHG